jgi:hypothetical protein
VKAKCQATKSAAVVVAHLKAAEQSLQSRFPNGVRASVGPGHGVAAWAAHFTREPVALRRVLHHLRRNLALFTPGTLEWCKDEKQSASRCLRLPQIPGAQPAESLNAWVSFLATQLDPAVPFFGLLPAGREWMDVIIGEPNAADFFLLRALPAAMPVVTDIPYQLDAESEAADARLLASLAEGRLPEISCLNQQPVESNRDAASKWLVRFRPGSRPGFLTRIFGMGSA